MQKNKTILTVRAKVTEAVCLAGDFFYHIRYFVGYRKEFLDTNKKTNYIARLETAKQIY
jgi:hypothetical protein